MVRRGVGLYFGKGRVGFVLWFRCFSFRFFKLCFLERTWRLHENSGDCVKHAAGGCVEFTGISRKERSIIVGVEKGRSSSGVMNQLQKR